MQKIIPHFWFDTQAKEAAEWYTSIFPDSRVTEVRTLHNTPSGDAEVVSFELMGFAFQAISAGPYFKPNPAISMMINFDPSQDPDARQRIDEIWEKLSEGGKALMELGEYPFSQRYGWIQDKYGFSWQLIYTNPQGEERPRVIPSLLFTEEMAGRAEEAMNFYLSVFKDARPGQIARYPADQEPDKEGTVMFEDFMLEGQWFSAMDSAREHGYAFSEATSLMVKCDTQEEIDYYWEKLSAVPEAEQCGWLKDRFGISWQVTPRVLDELMAKDQGTVDKVTKAFLAMKKFNIAVLKQAAE